MLTLTPPSSAINDVLGRQVAHTNSLDTHIDENLSWNVQEDVNVLAARFCNFCSFSQVCCHSYPKQLKSTQMRLAKQLYINCIV